MTTTTRRLAMLATVAVFAVPFGVGSASAAVVERDHFRVSGTEIVDVEDCGYSNLVHSFDFAGSVRVVQRGPNGPEMFSLNVHFHHSWTNEAGQTLTVRGTLLEKDLKLIDNGDGTTTLVVLLTGGFHASGSGGVIGADPGQTRLAITFDADGEVIDEQVVKGSTGRNDAGSLCEDLAAAFG